MNKLVTCPFDNAHKVKESRLPIHIAKCKLNHLDKQMFQCPFNSKHIIAMNERDFHLINCPDRAPLDKEIFGAAMDKNNPFKGNSSVPSYSAVAPVSEEYWDNEYHTATQIKPPPACAIIEPPPMAKPAERKNLYQELHRRDSEMAEQVNENSSSIEKMPKLFVNKEFKQSAPPTYAGKQPSASCHVVEKGSNHSKSVGFGRGQPGSASNRVAANIFPPSSANHSSNYSNALTSGMSNLVLGRGSAVGNTFDNEEFPVLGGCGRGLHKPNKKGPSGSRF